MSETTWQPIETAPKGKKLLVAYQNALGRWRRVCARYYEVETLDSADAERDWAEPGWYEECEAQETIYPVEHEPTHWMPLPDLPEAKQ